MLGNRVVQQLESESCVCLCYIDKEITDAPLSRAVLLTRSAAYPLSDARPAALRWRSQSDFTVDGNGAPACFRVRSWRAATSSPPRMWRGDRHRRLFFARQNSPGLRSVNKLSIVLGC